MDETLDSTISSPAQLAARFRQSGQFDQLRRSLMNDFLASPNRDSLVARLDQIIPQALDQMYPSVSKKDRHHRLVGDAANRGEIETRHKVLSGAIQEVERGLKAKERNQEGHGVLGPISAELDRTLRRSRGELIAEPTPRASTSAAGSTHLNGSNGSDSATLPTPPHPSDYLAPPAVPSHAASPSSPSSSEGSGEPSPRPPSTVASATPSGATTPLPPPPNPLPLEPELEPERELKPEPVEAEAVEAEDVEMAVKEEPAEPELAVKMEEVEVPNVVIVGLGLGGVAAAQALAKALPPTHRVVGISETEFGFFPPASLRASVVPGWQDKVTLTVAGVFPKGSKHVVLGSTKVVRINKNSVTVDVAHPDFGLEIQFDALVIATGSIYPFPCRPVEGTRNIVDVVASFETQQAAVKAASSVLVVGAGATGIEWAGEVKSQHPKKTVTLISSSETLFDSPTLTPKLGKTLKNQLESLGIDIVFGARLDTGDLKTGPIHKTIFTLNGGKTVAADYIFLATGTKPNSALVAAFDRDTVDNNGYAKVLDTLQISGYTNIFAIGDVTNRPETKQAVSTGNHIPIVTSNVVSVLKVHKIGAPLILVTVGPSGGAGQMFGFVVGSWVAKMAKSKGLMLPMFAGSYPAPK